MAGGGGGGVRGLASLVRSGESGSNLQWERVVFHPCEEAANVFLFFILVKWCNLSFGVYFSLEISQGEWLARPLCSEITTDVTVFCT